MAGLSPQIFEEQMARFHRPRRLTRGAAPARNLLTKTAFRQDAFFDTSLLLDHPGEKCGGLFEALVASSVGPAFFFFFLFPFSFFFIPTFKKSRNSQSSFFGASRAAFCRRPGPSADEFPRQMFLCLRRPLVSKMWRTAKDPGAGAPARFTFRLGLLLAGRKRPMAGAEHGLKTSLFKPSGWVWLNPRFKNDPVVSTACWCPYSSEYATTNIQSAPRIPLVSFVEPPPVGPPWRPRLREIHFGLSHRWIRREGPRVRHPARPGILFGGQERLGARR